VRSFTFELHEGADGWTVDDVIAIKPNFLASMGYQYLLSYGAPRARPFGSAIFYLARVARSMVSANRPLNVTPSERNGSTQGLSKL